MTTHAILDHRKDDAVTRVNEDWNEPRMSDEEARAIISSPGAHNDDDAYQAAKRHLGRSA